MIRSVLFRIALGMAASLYLTGCTLSTAGDPVIPQTAASIPGAATAPVTSPGTMPSTSAAQTIASGTTTTTTTTSSTASTTPPVTTSPLTTAPVTQPGTTTTGGQDKPVRSGDAWDTATVRYWLKNGPGSKDYPDNKLVFLTFDDGPSSNVTPKVLDVLSANGVHGTFFYYTYGGLSSRAEIVRRTHAEGHAIAIHTSSHKYNVLYPKRRASVQAILRDANGAEEDVQAILGADWEASVYRFPGGSFSWQGSASAREAMTATRKALAAEGMEYIDWNAMTGDSHPGNKDKSPSGLVKYAIRTTREAWGDVIVLLMHDSSGSINTTKALQGVIDFYKAEGYEFGILK